MVTLSDGTDVEGDDACGAVPGWKVGMSPSLP
jgi:hypothetical protein